MKSPSQIFVAFLKTWTFRKNTRVKEAKSIEKLDVPNSVTSNPLFFASISCLNSLTKSEKASENPSFSKSEKRVVFSYLSWLSISESLTVEASVNSYERRKNSKLLGINRFGKYHYIQFLMVIRFYLFSVGVEVVQLDFQSPNPRDPWKVCCSSFLLVY